MIASVLSNMAADTMGTFGGSGHSSEEWQQRHRTFPFRQLNEGEAQLCSSPCLDKARESLGWVFDYFLSTDVDFPQL